MLKTVFFYVFWSELVIRLGFAEICMHLLLSVCVRVYVYACYQHWFEVRGHFSFQGYVEALAVANEF